MTTPEPMGHGVIEAVREIEAPRRLVYDAWTTLEHRRQWFVGPGWTEIERHLDLRVGGVEVARGRFESGTETCYTARFHLIDAGVRQVYAFDMHVDERHFSVSLAGVEFTDIPGGTRLIYTEQAFFVDGAYGADNRDGGTNGLLEQFTRHVATLV